VHSAWKKGLAPLLVFIINNLISLLVNMIDYISKRQNSLKNIPEEEINLSLSYLVNYFDQEWLSDKENCNPVSELWKRKDWLATNELFSLGSFIKHLKTVDESWLTEQIKLVKGKSANNTKGALFEIQALGYLIPQNDIVPAKENQPGFDAVLNVNEVDFRISLKNFRISKSQSTFNDNVKSFEPHLRAFLEYAKLNKVQILIDSMTAFPEKKDWKKLKKRMPDIINEYKRSKTPLYAFEDKSWVVMILELKDAEYSEDHLSYSLIATSVYHKNEEKNIISKIEDACANLLKHSPKETNTLKNTLFIHIPPATSINNCFKWASSYFQENPNKAISAAIFYQPSLTTNLEKDNTFIHHCFKIYINDELADSTS